jgi:hypothetical protein
VQAKEAVNCEEYIANYLSAHADGELTPEERRAAERHLGSGPADGCAACRKRLAEERALKTLVRRQAAKLTAPAELQARINAALDRLDQGSAPQRAGVAVLRELRRPRTWAPLAAAAMLFVVLLAGGVLPGMRRASRQSLHEGTSAIPASEALDEAVYSYETFETAFRPNVPSASLSAITMAYGSAAMPDQMWNFQFAGYGVVGGRIDRLPNGDSVTYTLYHGRNSDILFTCYRANDFAVPPGAVSKFHGHLLYRYKGYSVAVLQRGGFTYVLTTSEPLGDLRRDISLACDFSVAR